jgi:hypothetical protein
MFGAKRSAMQPKKRKRHVPLRGPATAAFFLYPQMDWYGSKFGPGLKRRAGKGWGGLRSRLANGGGAGRAGGGMGTAGGRAAGAAAEAAEVAEVAVV